MPNYWAIGAIVLAVLTIAIGDTRALEESKYPDWSGQWERFVVRGLPGSRRCLEATQELARLLGEALRKPRRPATGLHSLGHRRRESVAD